MRPAPATIGWLTGLSTVTKTHELLMPVQGADVCMRLPVTTSGLGRGEAVEHIITFTSHRPKLHMQAIKIYTNVEFLNLATIRLKETAESQKKKLE